MNIQKTHRKTNRKIGVSEDCAVLSKNWTLPGSKRLFEKAEAYSERLTAIAEEMQKESQKSISPPNNWGAGTYAAQQERAVDIFSK